MTDVDERIVADRRVNSSPPARARRQYRTGHEQGEVNEIDFRAAHEILVRQLAATDDRDRTVGNEELVVQEIGRAHV